MRSIDYSWVIGLIVLVLVGIFWRPITGAITGAKDKLGNKAGIDRGKAVFYDTTKWLGPESYASCAMCHAADFTPDAGKQVKMAEYKPGAPLLLKDVGRRYGGGALDTGDELYQQITHCMTSPSRIAGGKVSPNVQYMQDLMAYVKSL